MDPLDSIVRCGQGPGLMAIPAEPQRGLGEAVRRLREKRGVTQEDLAHDAGITISTLSLLERGQSNPTWSTVKRVAAALGVSVAELAKLSEKLDRK